MSSGLLIPCLNCLSVSFLLLLGFDPPPPDDVDELFYLKWKNFSPGDGSKLEEKDDRQTRQTGRLAANFENSLLLDNTRSVSS